MKKTRVICAWHKKYFPDEGEYVINEGVSKDIVSHGICDRCSEILTAESNKIIKKMRKGNNGKTII